MPDQGHPPVSLLAWLKAGETSGSTQRRWCCGTQRPWDGPALGAEAFCHGVGQVWCWIGAFWARKALSRRWDTAGTSRPAGIQPPPETCPRVLELTLSLCLCSATFFVCVHPSVCLPFLCHIEPKLFLHSGCQWEDVHRPWSSSPLDPLPGVSLLHPEPVWPLGMPSKALCMDCASSRSWLSRACSDMQKFLPPSCGWMQRLCDRSGLPSHAEPLLLPLGTGSLLLFDKPPCWAG